MKFKIGDKVTKINSGLVPGIIEKRTASLCTSVVIEAAYYVDWADGNNSLHLESELTSLKGSNAYELESTC